jgi:uncharacterized protein (TIGR03437 family)
MAGLAAAQQYTISTVAGIPGVAGDHPLPFDTTPTLATTGQLYHPSVVALDTKGNFYIGDSYTFVIREVTASNGNISSIAGSGTPGYGGDNEVATSGKISDVHGIAVDSSGDVFISDTSNVRIREVVASSGNIITFAGTGFKGYSGDGGPALSALFSTPGALAFDSGNNLYVADYSASVVRKITPGGTITTFAGTGTYGYSGDGGAASKATLAYPVSLTFDAAGNLYIGDEGNSNIRKVDSAGNITTVVKGVSALGVGVDSAGNFYYVDGVSSRVRKVLATGGVVTIAGDGYPGYGGDGGPASQASVFQPAALATATDGSIYVADTMNDIIRRLVIAPTSIGVQDAASEVPGSYLQQGFISPGEVLLLFGYGLGPSTLTQFTVSNGSFPTTIAGTSVTFNGIPAPLIYASSGLVAVVAPYGISGSATASIALTYQGNTFTASMPVNATTPAMFTADASGAGQAAATNFDNGLANSTANPAKAGSFIELFATGAGYTTNPVDGQQTPTTCGVACLAVPQLPVTVKIGNQCVNPTYAGAVPTLVAGVMQVNVQIPATIVPGPVLVQVIVGGSCGMSTGYPSQAGVTIAISQ